MTVKSFPQGERVNLQGDPSLTRALISVSALEKLVQVEFCAGLWLIEGK
uniref:Uncharacterized protein n=1 Tax=Manihot esculenta TaxID=3983 RepID=A0A2C9U979_MANES